MSDFQKTEIQKEAIRLLSSEAKYAALFGGSRSGKTFIICYAVAVRACKVKSRHAIVRLHFNSVKRSVFQDTWPKVLNLCFPTLKVTNNKTDFITYFPNGSEVHFVGLDEGQRTEKLLGLEFSTLYFNEASEIDYSSMQMVITRLAELNSLVKKIYMDFNPAKKSHWSYWLFEKKLDPIDEVSLKDPQNYVSLLMNPIHNLANIDPDYIKLLETMPLAEKNRFLYGLYSDVNDGSAYYAFNRDMHVGDAHRRDGTIFSGLDFNICPFTAVIANFVDDRLEVFDEIYLENADTYKMVSELKKRGYGGSRIIPDSTCKSRRTSGMSDFQILKDGGFYVEDTFNPFQTDRVNNVNRLLTNNQITISPSCRKLINDLEKVAWKENKLDQTGVNKHLTHISDALGYLCWKLLPIMRRSEQRTFEL